FIEYTNTGFPPLISIDAANNNRTLQTTPRHYRHSRQQPVTLVAYSSLFKWRAHPGAGSNAKPGATVPITDHQDAQPNPDQLHKRNAPDTVEQPALTKKQRVATKETTTKVGKTTGTNTATNRTDSWSASYHQEVASLSPPPALLSPLQVRRTRVPSNLSTSASKPRRHPPMRPPPPASLSAQTTTCAAKVELVKLVKGVALEPSK
ncbi:hypothetical protein FRC08_003351, partial [Ceratobasidium sp. 394]